MLSTIFGKLDCSDMIHLGKNAIGLALALLAAICYGFIPLFTKSLQHPIEGLPLSSATILFYRFGIATLIMAAILLARRISFRITYPEFLRLVLLAFLSDGAALFLISGYHYLASSGVATTLHFMYPVMTALIMMLFFHEPRRLSTWIALTMAIGGVALLSGAESGAVHPLGVVLELVSALCFALYLIRIHRSSVATMPVEQLTFYVMGFGSLIFAAIMAYEQADFATAAHHALLPTASGWNDLIVLAVVCTVVTNLALVKATHIVGPTVASILGLLEPLTALMIGISFMGESFTSTMACGMSLILPAVLIIVLRKK